LGHILCKPFKQRVILLTRVDSEGRETGRFRSQLLDGETKTLPSAIRRIARFIRGTRGFEIGFTTINGNSRQAAFIRAQLNS
jgi:hypothetical protein